MSRALVNWRQPIRLSLSFILLAALVSCSHTSPYESPASEDAAASDAQASAPDREHEEPERLAGEDVAGGSESLDAQTTASTDDTLCRSVCASVPSNCPSPNCFPSCKQMLADNICGGLARLLLQCQSQITSDDYVCVNAIPTTKDHICPVQVKDWIECVRARR
jgi:hypothetical protein